MELVGITRNGQDEFVVRCEDHNYYYNGRPPLVSGCPECWNVYYFCQVAQSKDIRESVDQLESAVRHTKELVESGKWDFKPYARPQVQIEKDN